MADIMLGKEVRRHVFHRSSQSICNRASDGRHYIGNITDTDCRGQSDLIQNRMRRVGESLIDHFSVQAGLFNRLHQFFFCYFKATMIPEVSRCSPDLQYVRNVSFFPRERGAVQERCDVH